MPGASESTPLLGASPPPLPGSGSGGLARLESATTLYNEFLEQDSVSTGAMARQESALLVESTIPLALAYLLQFSFNFVNILSLGHLGANELGAAALANMTLFMLVNAPAVGLSSALDTFCSTAFTASRDKTLVGFHLQRGIISVTVHLLLMLPILLNLEPVLLALGQDPAISHLCSRFVRAQLPGTAPWIYFECVKRFLQAQGHMRAGTFVLLAVLPLHLANNYMLVWSPTVGIGFLGAAVANVVTFWAMLAGILAYVWYSDARVAWGGWTRRSLTSMRGYYRLAIPSMIMICSDWAAWELMALVASYLGNVSLAAQTIVLNTCSLTYQVPGGLSIAVSNRAGNLLGQARARRARVASGTGVLLGAASGALSSAFCLVVAGWWGAIYSSDPEVIASVAQVMPICALFQLSDALNGVSGGVLRSIGRQAAGAWINFPSYYIVGLPLGVYLTYGSPAMGLVGLWVGICISVCITSVGQLVICTRADYAKEVERCMAQVNKAQGVAGAPASGLRSDARATALRTPMDGRFGDGEARGPVAAAAPGEATPLLNTSPSEASLGIAKRDTSAPYFAIAKGEARWMASSSLLTALALMLEESFYFVNVISVSHLGATQLAAMALSVSCMGIFVLAPSFGLMSAVETFCSTAFTASRDKTMVGFHLQRGLVAAIMHMLVAAPILWNAEWLLLALRQDPEIARLSGSYLRIQILGVLPLSAFEACKCYLQAQDIMSAGTVVALIIAPIHWANNFFLVRSPTYGIGFIGAPIVTVVSEWLMLAGILLFIRINRVTETWGGWDARVLGTMYEFYRLAIPSIIASYSGWLGFEMLVLCASYFGANQLAGQAIMLNSVNLIFELSCGLGYATTARVGNLIGAAKPRQARIAADMGYAASALVGALCTLFLAIGGGWWTSVYTDDPDVARETAKLLPVACVFIVSDGMNAMGSAIMRGLGRQSVSGITYAIGLYCFGIPVGAILAFKLRMGVLGLWWGLCVGVLVACSAQLFYAKWLVDWNDEVRLALMVMTAKIPLPTMHSFRQEK
ncbi:ethionine resistance protein [Coemansia biformis]|uniref:Ethionine resistance protein n=1 Tax=Coemansia biformis TaxID=1286918 RepID=A0A9W8D027_9FUNG|nr:ethionine resistance protein [Coemansia biformis]